MAERSNTADWIAVDWGTTNLRAWSMSSDGTVLAKANSSKGMGGLSKTEFEPALLELITPWLGAGVTEVLACGMVGSRQGWAEASYRSVPTKATGSVTKVTCLDKRLDVSILPGIKQTCPADVMRGEETQIAGLLRSDPSFDGVVCMPGSHSKWAHISAEEVVSFQTFMTGEMFHALSAHTVLRHSVDTSDWDEDAFTTAVADALSRPESIAAKLFQLRAGELLENTPKAASRARLSGYLIGLELAGSRPYWLGQNVAIIGDPKLTELYGKALAELGVDAKQFDGDVMTLGGLTAAYKDHMVCLET